MKYKIISLDIVCRWRNIRTSPKGTLFNNLIKQSVWTLIVDVISKNQSPFVIHLAQGTSIE
jgi:hypothetical protein